MRLFLWGALAMACSVVGLFFLRYWTQSRDRLFMYFALAFGMFALNYVALAAVDPNDESRHWIFVLRLLAFGLIILGIVDKNRNARR